jgi:hypothetical protein
MPKQTATALNAAGTWGQIPSVYGRITDKSLTDTVEISRVPRESAVLSRQPFDEEAFLALVRGVLRDAA